MPRSRNGAARARRGAGPRRAAITPPADHLKEQTHATFTAVQSAARLSALLRLLPGDFRADFGHEMEGVFLDEHREAAGTRRAPLAAVAAHAGGILATAPAQHVDVLKQDLAYSGRALARTPAFAATAVLALALGIGGACAVFTLVDQVVLRQLPVPRPDRLVYFDSPSFSYPVVREVQRQVPSLKAPSAGRSSAAT